MRGHGAARRPQLFRADLADECVRVTDLDCVVGCRRLVRSEAILAGGSSGAVLMAVEQMKERIPRGATCALIFTTAENATLTPSIPTSGLRNTLGTSLTSGRTNRSYSHG